MAGGEGLGWMPQENSFRFSVLGIELPRMDDQRKAKYAASLNRYTESKGELFAIDDITGEQVAIITQDAARELRAASLIAHRIPVGKFRPIGMEEFTLQPGELAVVPIRWSEKGSEVEMCSTHPEGPAGLKVLTGRCTGKEEMSLIVENDSLLPITVTEQDPIAIGVDEEELPDLDQCSVVGKQRQRPLSLSLIHI